MSRSLSNSGSARRYSAPRLIRPAVVDLEVVELGAVGFAAAGGGEAALDLGRIGVEAAPEDEVHHALVGPIAIFEGDLLGHDVDPGDRLGRDVAYLGEAGDAAAVEQDDGAAVVAAAAAPGLRRDRVEQFGEAAGAERP